MPDIFSLAPGAVTAIDSPGLPPVAFSVDDWDGPTAGVVLTGLAAKRQTGMQFFHTLQEFVYAYVFGDRMGELVLSGVAFSNTCQDLVNIGEGGHGLSTVDLYYQTQRANVRASPIQVGLGTDTVFEAFLLGTALSLNDPDRHLGQFTLMLALLPPSRLS